MLLDNYNQYYRLAHTVMPTTKQTPAILYKTVHTGRCAAAIRLKDRICPDMGLPHYAERVLSFLKQPQHLSYEQIQDEMGNEPFYTEDGSTNLDLQRALDALPEQDKGSCDIEVFRGTEARGDCRDFGGEFKHCQEQAVPQHEEASRGAWGGIVDES